jgi:class I lanthipeptide synthase
LKPWYEPGPGGAVKFSPGDSSWLPLLAGGLAARAREAVVEIASVLSEAPAWMPGPLDAEGETAWRASLAAGDAGRALFYAYLAFHLARTGEELAGGIDPAETAVALLDSATDAVAAAPMSESLFSGFPGVAWVTDHLAGRLFETAGEDPNQEVDAALLALLSNPGWPREYDLINGLAGLGVYALEGLPRPTAGACLERIVERLAERADRTGEGIAWFSPPESLPPFQLAEYPRGLYNLGASHGAAGVVAVLSAACRAGIAAVAARRLLARAMEWLLARREKPERGFLFPHFFHPDVASRPSRLAWCYGDPGSAAALLVAARAAGEPAWEREAIAVALHAAARPVAGSGVRDACLCHGAAGVAHLFNRLYRATGEETLAAAARAWFEQALEHRLPGSGVGGFRSWASDLSGISGWRDDPGFLEGAAGVGLALLAAISPVDPEWDRLLLAATPPTAIIL